MIGYGAASASINISNSSFSGKINGGSSNISGCVGRVPNNGDLTIHRYAMTGSLNSPAALISGGLCGQCYFYGTKISESYVSGTIIANQWTGGLTAYAEEITNSFFAGLYQVGGNSGLNGGLVYSLNGKNQNNYVASFPGVYRNIKRNTSGAREIGGIGPNAANLYYLSGIGKGQSDSPILSRTHDQMSTSLPGITDNTDIWKFGTASYPYPILKWMEDDFVP